MVLLNLTQVKDVIFLKLLNIITYFNQICFGYQKHVPSLLVNSPNDKLKQYLQRWRRSNDNTIEPLWKHIGEALEFLRFHESTRCDSIPQYISSPWKKAIEIVRFSRLSALHRLATSVSLLHSSLEPSSRPHARRTLHYRIHLIATRYI